MLDRATRWFLRFRDRGDIAALGYLFDHSAPELLRIARNLTRDLADAEDLVQTTFLTAIESAPSFERGRRVAPWLAAILTHAAQAERRRRQRAPQDGDDADQRADRARSPGDDVAGREVEQRTRDALERLPEPYRQPTLLRVAHGLPPAEIALLLGRSPGTVRAQIHRGLAQLRQRLPASTLALAGADLGGRGLTSLKAEVLAHAAHFASGAALSTTVTGAFVMSKKTLAAALLVLAGLTFAIVARGDRDVAPASPVGAVAARVETVVPRDPAPNEGARTSVAPRRTEWIVVDDLGAPVGNARVRIDGLEHASAGDGTGASDLLAEGADATAECDLHEPWSGHLDAGATNRIVLPRSESACVTALDEDGAPVRGAVVWLARDWGTPATLRTAGAPSAVTNAAGKARFRGLPADRYRIHVEHDLLVFSHGAQQRDPDGSPGHILCSVPGNEVITLSHPYVLAYQLARSVEGQCSLRLSGARLHHPRNPDGQEALRRLRSRLLEASPSAQISLLLRDPHKRGEPLPGDTTASDPRCWVQVQAVGHAELKVPLTPVRFADFVAPIFIDASAAAPSDEFGSVTVWLGEPGRDAIDGIELFLDRFGTGPGRNTFPSKIGMPLRSGKANALPTGTYTLRASEPLVSGLAKKQPRFALAKGEQKVIVLGKGLAWTSVRFSIAAAPELPGRTFAANLPAYARLRLPGTDVSEMKGFNSRAGLEVLAPAGRVEVLVTLPSDRPDMIWSGSTTVTVGPDARGPFEIGLRETLRESLRSELGLPAWVPLAK